MLDARLLESALLGRKIARRRDRVSPGVHLAPDGCTTTPSSACHRLTRGTEEQGRRRMKRIEPLGVSCESVAWIDQLARTS